MPGQLPWPQGFWPDPVPGWPLWSQPIGFTLQTPAPSLPQHQASLQISSCGSRLQACARTRLIPMNPDTRLTSVVPGAWLAPTDPGSKPYPANHAPGRPPWTQKPELPTQELQQQAHLQTLWMGWLVKNFSYQSQYAQTPIKGTIRYTKDKEKGIKLTTLVNQQFTKEDNWKGIKKQRNYKTARKQLIKWH